MCRVVWNSVPIDHVWRAVQRMDILGNSLLSVVDPATNPFYQAHCHFAALLTTDDCLGDLKVLLDHFHHPDMGTGWREPRAKHQLEYEDSTLSMAAHMWWRLELLFMTWPFRLLALISNLFSDAEKLEICRRVYTTPMCCLDAYFTKKARILWPSYQEMYNSMDFRACLRSWGRGSPLANMHLERLLALIKNGVAEKTNQLLKNFSPLASTHRF